MDKSIIQIIADKVGTHAVLGKLSDKALTLFKQPVLMWALVEESNVQGVQSKQERSVEGIVLHQTGPIHASEWPGFTLLGYSKVSTKEDMGVFKEIAEHHFNMKISKEPDPSPAPDSEPAAST